jgi:uncharacterized membrane protein YdjX (TVP38/TMEM64 family)
VLPLGLDERPVTPSAPGRTMVLGMTRSGDRREPEEVRHGPPALPVSRRYLLVVAGLLAVLLVTFLAAEAVGVPLLADPTPAMAGPTPAAAAVGLGLLLADVALPVPASAVMIAHGALFGAAAGAALSTVGGVGATLLAFLVGRRSRRLVHRLVGEREQQRADRFLDRYGSLALVVTRPIPMLAETVAIAAGASRVRWRSAALAAVAGTVPAAGVYAVAGAAVATVSSGLVAFAAVVLLAAVPWLAVRLGGAGVTGAGWGGARTRRPANPPPATGDPSRSEVRPQAPEA